MGCPLQAFSPSLSVLVVGHPQRNGDDQQGQAGDLALCSQSSVRNEPSTASEAKNDRCATPKVLLAIPTAPLSLFPTPRAAFSALISPLQLPPGSQSSASRCEKTGAVLWLFVFFLQAVGS